MTRARIIATLAVATLTARTRIRRVEREAFHAGYNAGRCDAFIVADLMAVRHDNQPPTNPHK